jgi:3-methyladenine DNA glycosylase AlkD
MNNLVQVRRELRAFSNPKRAKLSARYFKTGEGEYGFGDIFIGLTVPQVQAVAEANYKNFFLRDVLGLLKSKIHEERQLGLMILTRKFKKANEIEREQIFNLYLEHTYAINNWDLVDGSAPTIVGGYLLDRDRGILKNLAKSENLWERRIAILATFAFLGKGQPTDTLDISVILLNDSHDLIHKAVGWALREVGKKCGQDVEERFLRKNYQKMPRTMLRYAIERFPETIRQKYLKGLI